ncbi:MAG: zinc ribbon domain-containing protein, partial [Oscillospiraceae bacterium]|nr:zinc ribbon domain-containing protein [Oscillospiraceae bacterium]
MFCTQCGTQLPDGSRFCTNCGAKLAEFVEKAAAEQPAFTPPAAPVP